MLAQAAAACVECILSLTYRGKAAVWSFPDRAFHRYRGFRDACPESPVHAFGTRCDGPSNTLYLCTQDEAPRPSFAERSAKAGKLWKRRTSCMAAELRQSCVVARTC